MRSVYVTYALADADNINGLELCYKLFINQVDNRELRIIAIEINVLAADRVR